MLTKKALSAVLALVLAGTAALSAGPSLAASGPPPLLGHFQDNFTLLDPPLPTPQNGFTDLDGKTLSLADFRGEVLVLNFWATWCAPCIREMPELEALQAAYKDKGLKVLAVSQDRGSPLLIEQFIKELGLTEMHIFLDPKGELSSAFKLRGLPTTFLIDSNGNLVGGLDGPADWNSPDARALVEHYLPAAAPAVVKTGG